MGRLAPRLRVGGPCHPVVDCVGAAAVVDLATDTHALRRCRTLGLDAHLWPGDDDWTRVVIGRRPVDGHRHPSARLDADHLGPSGTSILTLPVGPSARRSASTWVSRHGWSRPWTPRQPTRHHSCGRHQDVDRRTPRPPGQPTTFVGPWPCPGRSPHFVRTLLSLSPSTGGHVTPR